MTGDANGHVLTLCGVRDATQVDGHDGYDYRMPEGTPLRAVADGRVLFAGLERLRPCPALGRSVQALLIELVHDSQSGERLVSVYGTCHAWTSRRGPGSPAGRSSGSPATRAAAARRISTSALARDVDGEYRLFDPYGWHGAGDDPWALDLRGVPSIWMWNRGQAPPL